MAEPMTDGEALELLIGERNRRNAINASRYGSNEDAYLSRALSRALEWHAAIERVRKTHAEVTYPEDGIFCRECQRGYPCPTIRALDRATA